METAAATDDRSPQANLYINALAYGATAYITGNNNVETLP